MAVNGQANRSESKIQANVLCYYVLCSVFNKNRKKKYRWVAFFSFTFFLLRRFMALLKIPSYYLGKLNKTDKKKIKKKNCTHTCSHTQRHTGARVYTWMIWMSGRDTHSLVDRLRNAPCELEKVIVLLALIFKLIWFQSIGINLNFILSSGQTKQNWEILFFCRQIVNSHTSHNLAYRIPNWYDKWIWAFSIVQLMQKCHKHFY